MAISVHEIFPNQVFLDFPVNLGIVGQIISECTHPQTADHPDNCSVVMEEKPRQDRKNGLKSNVMNQFKEWVLLMFT